MKEPSIDPSITIHTQIIKLEEKNNRSRVSFPEE